MQTEQELSLMKFRETVRNLRLIDDDFMRFVFSDNECAELLLRIILKRDDLKVQKVEPEPTIPNVAGRAVRLDIVAYDTANKVYNIEVQRADRGAVPKRARYNSAMLDTKLLNKGDEFWMLPETYVIFITENDVLKKGLPLYHIQRVVEETGTVFGDDTHIVYVNSKIQDETALGRLMADFYEVNPDKMHHPTLADRTRYYKYEEGEIEVCRSIEALCEQAREQAREEVHLEVELKKDVEHVCKLMRTQGCDEHTAMDMLETPKERREAILQAIQKEK